MSESGVIPEPLEPFFSALLQHTNTDRNKTVSMTVVGADIGLDKASASRAVEELMALGLVEIRTLSGGIGLTEDGKRMAEQSNPVDDPEAVLGKEPHITEAAKAAMKALSESLHHCIAALPSGFDSTQALSDIHTLEIQLASPHPWTAILRECLKAIQSDLGNRLEPALEGRIRRLLA
uniref:Uncharacterized protein n=1 Tax=Desulfatirhabdium butyrativorans TaxID=340467 RepID=A0A7C4MK66_9BACT